MRARLAILVRAIVIVVMAVEVPWLVGANVFLATPLAALIAIAIALGAPVGAASGFGLALVLLGAALAFTRRGTGRPLAA